MSHRSRWIAVAVLVCGTAGIVAVLRFLPTAEAGRSSPPTGLVGCDARPAIGPGAIARPGSFYRLQPRLDANGAMAGQRLFVGRDGIVAGTADLPAEASASGPIDGVVAITEDDGSASRVELASVIGGCRTVIHATTSVVRRALIDPVDGSVLLYLLDRQNRADLGVWRLSPGAADATRLVEPLPASLGFGPIWSTNLLIDAEGGRLAVQSCIDVACLTRIVDLGAPTREPVVIRGTDQGEMLGFAGSDLVTWAACDGFPCRVLAWDTATGVSRPIAAGAIAAGLTSDGGLLVVVPPDGTAQTPTVVDPATARSVPLHGLAGGERPIANDGSALEGLEVAGDGIAVGMPAGQPRAIRPTAAGELVP